MSKLFPRIVGKMRPVFCGNFDYETRQYDLERLFSKYGKVDRVDMKSGETRESAAIFLWVFPLGNELFEAILSERFRPFPLQRHSSIPCLLFLNFDLSPAMFSNCEAITFNAHIVLSFLNDLMIHYLRRTPVVILFLRVSCNLVGRVKNLKVIF